MSSYFISKIFKNRYSAMCAERQKKESISCFVVSSLTCFKASRICCSHFKVFSKSWIMKSPRNCRCFYTMFRTYYSTSITKELNNKTCKIKSSPRTSCWIFVVYRTLFTTNRTTVLKWFIRSNIDFYNISTFVISNNIKVFNNSMLDVK